MSRGWDRSRSTSCSIKSVPKVKTSSDFIADSIFFLKMLGQKQVDSLLQGLVMWTAETREQMVGNCLLRKELLVDPHVV